MPTKKPAHRAENGSVVRSISMEDERTRGPSLAERSVSPEVPDSPDLIARIAERVRATQAADATMTARRPELVEDEEAQVGESSDIYWQHFE